MMTRHLARLMSPVLEMACWRRNRKGDHASADGCCNDLPARVKPEFEMRHIRKILGQQTQVASRGPKWKAEEKEDYSLIGIL